MKYVAVVSWGLDGRVAKFKEFDLAADAEAHVEVYGGFVSQTPDGRWSDWQVSPDIPSLFYNPLANTPEPPVVTPRQARLALLGAGLLDAVETELAKPENKAAQLTWEYALEVRRDDPLIAAIGAALQITDQQIDALFEAAKEL